MAHWISSKLKAAENLLHQIDQQAAESLRKNEQTLSDDTLSVENSSRSPETKPLIKDQLKKKSPENVGNQSITPSKKNNKNIIHRSSSDVNSENGGGGLGRPLNLNLKSNVSGGLPDNDWTELLSVPDKRGVSGVGSASQSPKLLSGIRALKKDGKKPSLNLSMVDKRNEKAENNGVLRSSRKLNVGLENGSSCDSDEKASNTGDATPRSSSVKSHNNGDQRGSSLAPIIDNGIVQSTGKIEDLTDIGDGEKLQQLDSNHSTNMMPISHERESDTKVGLDTGERFKGGLAQDDRLTMGSAISGSINKTSPTSDQESNSESDTSSSSDSESEREGEERKKRRQQILAEKAAAKALQAVKERENLVARLEGEKQSLEKIIEERAKQQVQEASELQTTMMETMEAVELEKQKHNNTRMEVLARLAKLESANADLARSLANAQKKLEVEVHHVAELRQQIHMKEATHEELRRKISRTHQNGDHLRVSKGVELELKMLEAEYSFIADKVERMHDQAKSLETSIETTRREIENPTDVEIELKQRLSQLTDHLIQKQAQVETLSSEKATLLFRIEAISRMVDENKAMLDLADFPGTSSRTDLESGGWKKSYSNMRPSIQEKIRSGQRHFGSLVVQLDSLFCAGVVFLKRNKTARIWALVYLVCLHFWVLYILTSHSQVSDDRSGAVISLENINNTGGGI